jgi:hypothetical protein
LTIQDRRQRARKKTNQNKESQWFHYACPPGPDYFRTSNRKAEKKQYSCIVWGRHTWG